MGSDDKISNISQIFQIGHYLNDQGKVDYFLIQNDKWFNSTLKEYETKDISYFSKPKLMAFWINTYNLLTIQSVLLEFAQNPSWKGNFSLFTNFDFFIFGNIK